MAKHARVCEKVFATKRKPMDIAKMRAEGTNVCACVRVRVFVCMK